MEVRHTMRLLVLALTLLQVGSVSLGQARDQADQAETQAVALQDAPLQDKRGWADFNSWGKRWSDFPSWGKKWSNFPSWGKKWSNFPSWGKRWSNFPSWGKKWSNFPSWGKKWSNFPSWGKKWSNFASWGKKWSLRHLPQFPARTKNTSWDFSSWGKRGDPDQNKQGGNRDKRVWNQFITWGKRGGQSRASRTRMSGWRDINSWGKRSSSEQDASLEAQKVLAAIDANGDGELQPEEAVELLAWLEKMQEQTSQ